MSRTTIGAIVLAVLVLAVAGEAIALWFVRRRVAQIEHADIETSEKVHRLQRLLLGVVGGVPAAIFVVLAGLAALAGRTRHHHHHTSVAAVATLIVILVALVVLPALMARTIGAALRRIRGTSKSVPHRGRRLAAGFGVGILYAGVIVAGEQFVPRHGTAHLVGMILVYAVALFIFASVLVPLLLIRIVTTPMPESRARELRRLADDIGVRVRGFRIMKTRNQKAANAMQVGTLPGLRYVVVTDYLADHLEPDQLAAVVAHELGHARCHHVLRKLLITFGAWAVAEGVLIGVGDAVGASHVVHALVAPLVLLVPASILLSQGLLGIRFEKDADDIAAKYVGRRQLAAALRCLGELNHTKRDTGRAWSILTQHPGLQERLERLGQPDSGRLQPSG
jgi:STE24 endopeptidase